MYSKELLLLNFTETRTDNRTNHDHDPRLYRPKVNKTTGLVLVISMVLVWKWKLEERGEEADAKNKNSKLEAMQSKSIETRIY